MFHSTPSFIIAHRFQLKLMYKAQQLVRYNGAPVVKRARFGGDQQLPQEKLVGRKSDFIIPLRTLSTLMVQVKPSSKTVMIVKLSSMERPKVSLKEPPKLLSSTGDHRRSQRNPRQAIGRSQKYPPQAITDALKSIPDRRSQTFPTASPPGDHSHRRSQKHPQQAARRSRRYTVLYSTTIESVPSPYQAWCSLASTVFTAWSSSRRSSSSHTPWTFQSYEPTKNLRPGISQQPREQVERAVSASASASAPYQNSFNTCNERCPQQRNTLQQQYVVNTYYERSRHVSYVACFVPLNGGRGAGGGRLL